MSKYVPLDKDALENITKTHPTPFYLYDEKAIRENARNLKQAFSVLPGFKEYFAVKGLANPFILKILADENFGADCSSLPEIILCEKAGITGENIMFSSNETPASEYLYANMQNAIINLDDITHIDFLKNALGAFPELICFRYNPGPLKEGNAIIGKPEEAKYGLTREQIIEAYGKAKELGATRFGLHTMVASNELANDYFIETAHMLYELAAELKKVHDITLEFINMGGGIGIPYRPDQKAVDYNYVAQGVKVAYDKVIVNNPVFKGEIAQDVTDTSAKHIKFFMECARVITGPYGYLVTRAIHQKHIYREYIGVDSCMADLMRPGMYGAYHEITVMGKENAECSETYDVVGSLCENCDKFAVQRSLPKIDIGDIIVIHDAGAHGRVMGFNYNGKLRCGELLLREDGSVMQIRRKETVDDYFATLDFDALQKFKA
ncbi:MAG: diaminopimelate decarboxylase [Spirochaetales bacterium]